MKIKQDNPNFTDNYIEQLLKYKGIEDIEAYLHPTEELLQDPAALKNIQKGAVLFNRVVLNDTPPYSRVLIIVD